MIRPPIFGPSNFGVIDFDMTLETPELKFNAIDEYGRALYDPLVISTAELVNGASSRTAKVKR